MVFIIECYNVSIYNFSLLFFCAFCVWAPPLWGGRVEIIP